MTRSESPQIQVSAAPGSEPAAAPNIYTMSREGRRQAVILLLGVITLWVAALWIGLTILQDGIGLVEWVSLVLMLGILAVAPVVSWALVEEATAHISTDASGIRYRAAGGIDITCSREELRGFKPRRGLGRVARFFMGGDLLAQSDVRNLDNQLHDSPAPGRKGAVNSTHFMQGEDGQDTLLLQTSVDPAARIPNPLVRFLHRLAYGTAIPIYAGLENRDELMKDITLHLEPANPEGAC